MTSEREKARKKRAKACAHYYVFMETWQDAHTKFWSFHCVFCLEIMIRTEPLEFLKAGR